MASVLVVDDDDDMAELVVLLLESRGHDVRRAANGRDGLDLLRDRLPDYEPGVGRVRFAAQDLSVAHVAGRVLVSALGFELRDGERVALVAPSGAGKTTTLRALALLIDPVGGEVRLDGRTPREHGIPSFQPAQWRWWRSERCGCSWCTGSCRCSWACHVPGATGASCG